MKRKAKRTILIVGEGRHEEAFLSHLKRLYVDRGCGLSVSIKNARGKGAKHVVDWTVRQIRHASYDVVAVLLDTDQDWTPAVLKKAKSNKIVVLTSDPCFEALLLRAMGKRVAGNAKALKKAFAPYVKRDPARPENYREHFSHEGLQTMRTIEATIDQLLRLFNQ